jgi:putative tricarboxylic transport membrane protein
VSKGVDADNRKARPAKREDVVGAIVVLALAALIIIGGLGIPNSSYANAVLSPRDFPFLIGILMAVAGAVLLLRNASALLPGRGGSAPTEESRQESAETNEDLADLFEERAPQNFRILGLLFALLLVYILVFVWLGYVLSTFLFLGCAAMLLAPRKPARNLIFAAGLSIAVYLLFTEALNVLLPPGPLGGLI